MKPKALAALWLAGLVPASSVAQVKTFQVPAIPVVPLAAAGVVVGAQPTGTLKLPQTLLKPVVLDSPHPLPRQGRGERGLGLAYSQLLAAAAPAAEPSTEVPLLARADELGVPRQKVAEEIRASESYEDAAERLAGLGLMSRAAAAAAATQRPTQLRYSLHRLWYEVAPTLPPQFESDERWPVPALVARKDGVTYYIHGLFHGSRGNPIGWRATRALVRALEARGLPLYWEQGLPGHYGSSYGREALDHTTPPGQPAPLRDAPKSAAFSAALTALRRLAWTGAFLALPAVAIAHDPLNPLGWLGLGLAAAPIAEAWTGFRRLAGLHMWSEAKATPLPDEAHNALERIRAAFGRRVSFPQLWRVDLPAPLKLVELPRVAERSESIALAVAEEAAARSLREVHIIVGYNHAAEVAWHLSR